MNIKSISSSITLTNVGNKKYLSIMSFSNDEQKNSKNIEIDNELDNIMVKNFLDTNIKSIKHAKSFIGDNKYRECIELKNSGNSNLIIISDNINLHFKDLYDYIQTNRTKIYEKKLFDSICKYNLDEIAFKLSNNNKNSEIVINNIDGKNRLTYYLPYDIGNNNRKIILKEDLDLIQTIINNYVVISKCKLLNTYDEGALGYLLSFQIITDKANIIINDSEIYYQLELYFNLIKREIERQNLIERDKNFEISEKNIRKHNIKILKPENNEE